MKEPLAARQRPRQHSGETPGEVAILEATERLLGEAQLHEISVQTIIKEAGISRAGFYFYFGSKHDVLGSLLSGIFDDVFAVIQPWLQEADDPRTDTLPTSLGRAVEMWAEHGAVIGAVMEAEHAVPELHDVWMQIVDRFADAIAGVIDRERARGIAPPGGDSRALAASLVWATARILHVAQRGVDATLPDSSATLAPLKAMWLGTIYAAAPQD